MSDPGPREAAPEAPDAPEAAGPTVFHVPQTYRRRRLGDAARLLPVLGGVLFLLPAFGIAPADGGARIAVLGAAWLGLIVGAAILSRALQRARAPRADEAP